MSASRFVTGSRPGGLASISDRALGDPGDDPERLAEAVAGQHDVRAGGHPRDVAERVLPDDHRLLVHVGNHVRRAQPRGNSRQEKQDERRCQGH